jgi:GNAT superfamily N-acetyltransferase
MASSEARPAAGAACGPEGLVIRAARPDDRAAVLDFCARGSDRGDYISEVFDAWVADPDGDFLVAELDGRPVGVARVLADDGQAWFEGLRVDPIYRRRGIARRLTRAEISCGRRRGCPVARSMISDDNGLSRRVSESEGLARFCGLRFLLKATGARADDRPAAVIAGGIGSAGVPGQMWPLRPLAPDEATVARVVRDLHDGALLRCPDGAPGLLVGRRWRPASDWVVRQVAAQRELWALPAAPAAAAPGAWRLLAAVTVRGDKRLDVVPLTGDPAACREVARAARHEARRLGCPWAQVVVLQGSPHEELLLAAGFHPPLTWTGRIGAYEMKLQP